MRYTGVFPPDLAVGDVYWPQIAALLARSLPYGRGEYTLDDIRDGIAGGEIFALGTVEDNVVELVDVCALLRSPRKTVLYVLHGAGRVRDVEHRRQIADALEDAGRKLGADWIETRTRAALARLYRRHGYDIGYIVAIKEIPPK